MQIVRIVVGIFIIGLMVLGTGVAFAQNFPNKPIRIVTAETGGSADVVSRLIAPELTGPLRVPVIVQNRPGGVIVGDIVAKAEPDGYTLLLGGSSHWLAPFMSDNVPYDVVRDFAPIAMVTTSPNMIVAHPALPVKSVKELIALAQAKPGTLNYGSGTLGTTSHLTGALFTAMARVNIVNVTYKGVGPGLVALIAGEVQLMFPSAGAAWVHVKSGKLRALAVTSAQPSALVPGVPTATASGLPGFESALMFATFAPAKTPAAIIGRLNQEIVRALRREDMKERLLNAGVEGVGNSPNELAATLKSEMAVWGKLIKDLGVRGK